jgi:hypothetical protein
VLRSCVSCTAWLAARWPSRGSCSAAKIIRCAGRTPPRTDHDLADFARPHDAFDRVSVEASWIDVDTTDGYQHGLDDIVRFVNGPAWVAQCSNPQTVNAAEECVLSKPMKVAFSLSRCATQGNCCACDNTYIVRLPALPRKSVEVVVTLRAYRDQAAITGPHAKPGFSINGQVGDNHQDAVVAVAEVLNQFRHGFTEGRVPEYAEAFSEALNDLMTKHWQGT